MEGVLAKKSGKNDTNVSILSFEYTIKIIKQT